MNAIAREVTPAPSFREDDYDVFHRIGTLTRQLHDALRELGYDTQLQGAVGTLPDARSRLDYIARLTDRQPELAETITHEKATSPGASAIRPKVTRRVAAASNSPRSNSRRMIGSASTMSSTVASRLMKSR